MATTAFRLLTSDEWRLHSWRSMIGRRLWPLWVALLSTIAVGVAVIAFPTFYIMPFKPQKATVMSLALQARAVAPIATTIALVLSAAIAFILVLRSRRWWSRTLPILALAPIALATWFAHQNHFEWMFNPLDSPRYVDATKATFVKSDDIVMAVEIEGEAVAYPVRQMGYHHLVNDVIGRKPIVATY